MSDTHLTDIQWLEREAAHCRRMDYAEPAKRYERIAKALKAAPPNNHQGQTHEE